MTKQESNRRHAVRRARERYGLSLSDSDLSRIVSQIRHGRKAKKVRDCSLRRSVWAVEFGGVRIGVVYEDNRKAGRRGVVTVLPEGAV